MLRLEDAKLAKQTSEAVRQSRVATWLLYWLVICFAGRDVLPDPEREFLHERCISVVLCMFIIFMTFGKLIRGLEGYSCNN